MKNLNKGIVKVEKFEAVQDEDGNWIPVGDALETVEKENALSSSVIRKLKTTTNNSAGWFAGSASTSQSAASGDLTKPGNYNPQIFISEFPTAFPGSIPGRKTGQTATDTIDAPNRGGEGLYHGSFRSLGYSDRDSDESKTILVLKHRFDPDISRDRSIKSIGLSHITALNLASTFIQTSSQILDVTYTIEIDLSNIEYPIFSRVEKTLKKHLSFPAGKYDTFTALHPNYSVLMPQSKIKPGVAIGIEDDLTDVQYIVSGHQTVPLWNHDTTSSTWSTADENGYADFNITNQLDGVYAPATPTISYLDATHEAGMLLGNVVSTCTLNGQRNIHEWHNSRGSVTRTTTDLNLRYFISQQTIADSSDTTAIQNTFPRSGPSLPYQDVDALAVGTGAIRIADSDGAGSSWTGNDDGLAKKYRINITTGGATGVSEYNIQKRNWAGSVGNAFIPRLTPLPYTNLQNSNSSDSDGLGGIVIPFADDSKHGYHGQNPGRAGTSTTGSFNDNILSTGLHYKYPEFITYDKTGFTVVHMNNVGKNFEANFSQICQIVVKQNAARDIYVADVSSGLWKIERTEGQGEDEATVTRLTASGAADDTTCRGVQVKNDGTIWAIFDEEMCSSADDGSTWTVYNASTATQFKLTDVADTTSGTSNPNRLYGFTIDRYNSEDRFFIPARDATSLSHSDTTHRYFWWSRAGSSTGTSDEIYNNLSGGYQNWNLRAGSDTVWCSKGGVWYLGAYTPSAYMKAANWGSSTWYNQGYAWSSTYKTPVFGSKAHWWQDANGEEWVLGATSKSTNEQCLIAVRSDRFVPSDNTSNLSFFPAGLSYSAPNPHEDGGKRLNDRFSDVDGSFLNGSTNSNLPNLLGMASPTTFIVKPNDRSYVQVGLTGSSFDSAGSPNVGDWIDYGWNGSAWVEGSSSSKATHTSRDALVDGLTIKFDGADAASFVASEYYDGYVYNGILKDDATTFSVGLRQTYLDVDTTTDFSSTVPTVSSGVVTEPAYLGDARSQSSKILTDQITFWAEQGNWSSIGYLSSYPIMMRSEQGMLGDLTVTFKLAEINIYSNSSSPSASIGLIQLHTNPYSNSYQYSVHGDAVRFDYGGRPNTTDGPGDLTLTFYQGISTVQTTVVLTDYDPNDDFKIERTSGNVKWYRNNVLIHTSNITGDNEKVNFFINRNANNYGNFTLNDIELTYIDSDGPRVTVGDGVSTGASNPDFRKIATSSIIRDDYNEIFIDGVPAIINYDVSLPPAGECTILPHSGKIRFDPSDAGATITGKIGYLKKF